MLTAAARRHLIDAHNARAAAILRGDWEAFRHHSRTIARLEAQALYHANGCTADVVRQLKQCAL